MSYVCLLLLFSVAKCYQVLLCDVFVQEEESNLLRQKIAALEQHLVESDTRVQETQEEFAKNRRLVKLLEKYKCELNDANVKIEDLKNKVTSCNELQVGNCCMYQEVVV